MAGKNKRQMEETEDKPEPQYMVPPSMAFAMSTNRPEMLELTIREVQDEKIKPSEELTVEILRFTRDTWKQLEVARRALDSAGNTIKRLEDRLEHIAGVANGDVEVPEKE